MSDPSRTSSWRIPALFSAVVPVAAAVILYIIEPFEPAPYPAHELSGLIQNAPSRNDRMLYGSEMVGFGKLPGPEDLAYDSASSVMYAGCADGWVKKVKVADSVNDTTVEDWVITGGRPLGIALDIHNQVIVADPDRGLLRVSNDGSIEVLVEEVEGVKCKFVDGVDVAKDGIIYFTDASYKYKFSEFIWDILEGKPNGRFLSYDPETNQTKVLAHDLFFANGVVVSPDQTHVIFCETPVRRCKKYYVKGPKRGSLETFVEHLPGMPDNIRYDGEGSYWIAMSSSPTRSWDLALRYPFLRKGIAILEKYVGRPHMEKNGGVLVVDLEGKLVAHYYDPSLSLISSGLKIGNHIYCGSLSYPFIIRLDISQFPARATA